MKGMGQGTEPRRSEAKKPPPPLIRANFPRGSSNLKMEPRKILPMPKMPILQPPSTFSRSGGVGVGGGGGGGTSIKNRMDMPKLNPPPLKMLRKPEGQGRSNVSVSAVDMRSPIRRGRPPRNLLIPQLNNRSLTITPISIPRRGIQAPPVPNLQPMMNRGLVRRPNLPHQHLKGQINPPSLGGSSMFSPHNCHNVPKRPLLAFPRPNAQQPRFRLPQRNVSGGVRPLNVKQNVNPLTFKRYAQSVVTINQKKYIVLPKAKEQAKSFLLQEDIASSNEHKNVIGFNSNGDLESSDEESEGLEVLSEKDQQTILKNAFSHLGLKDLLNCSLVSESWRTIAFDTDLVS
jgi:hypothetical protein